MVLLLEMHSVVVSGLTMVDSVVLTRVARTFDLWVLPLLVGAEVVVDSEHSVVVGVEVVGFEI